MLGAALVVGRRDISVAVHPADSRAVVLDSVDKAHKLW